MSEEVLRPPHPGGEVGFIPTPCEECPWRKSNQERAHDPRGWYTSGNLARIWSALREGQRQTCHPTDWRAAGSRGYETHAVPGQTKECAGSLTLVLREMAKYEEHLELEHYVREWPNGLTIQGLLANRERWSRSGWPELDLDDEAIGYDNLAIRVARDRS